MRCLLRTLAILFFATATAVYASVCAYMFFKQDVLIFPQRINTYKAERIVAQPTTLTMQDGTVLEGAIVNPQPGPNPTLVLLFGGNAHDVGGFVNFWGTDILPASVSNTVVVGMAYRGYGTFLTPLSQGKPSEAIITQDAQQILQQLTAHYQPKRTAIIGYSLGTAAAARLAYVREKAGTPADYLVLIAPFTAMTDLAKIKYSYLPIGLLLRHPFATASFFAELRRTPTLLLYTPDDAVVPAAQTKKLHKINPQSDIVELPGTTHGDILYHPHLPPLLRHAAGLQ